MRWFEEDIRGNCDITNTNGSMADLIADNKRGGRQFRSVSAKILHFLSFHFRLIKKFNNHQETTITSNFPVNFYYLPYYDFTVFDFSDQFLHILVYYQASAINSFFFFSLQRHTSRVLFWMLFYEASWPFILPPVLILLPILSVIFFSFCRKILVVRPVSVSLQADSAALGICK